MGLTVALGFAKSLGSHLLHSGRNINKSLLDTEGLAGNTRYSGGTLTRLITSSVASKIALLHFYTAPLRLHRRVGARERYRRATQAGVERLGHHSWEWRLKQKREPWDVETASLREGWSGEKRLIVETFRVWQHKTYFCWQSTSISCQTTSFPLIYWLDWTNDIESWAVGVLALPAVSQWEEKIY